MKFDLLRKGVISEINSRMPKIENEEELNNKLVFYGKEYQGDYETKRKKLLSFILKRIEKEKEVKLNLIKSIEEADEFKPLVITIEWKKSKMWGSNPTAYTNFGFKGESIGGCGYCKKSTATAQALNSYKPILKLLYAREEERLKKDKKNDKKRNYDESLKDKYSRRNFLGYGSGYGVLPSFEGGVGVSSHEYIIKNLGLKWEYITDTNSTDVYMITK